MIKKSWYFNRHGEPHPGHWVLSIVAGIFLIYFLFASFFTVTAGQRAIVFTFGEITQVRAEGLWMKMPFVQTIETVSVRAQRSDSDADAVSKNMQPVNTTVTLNWYLDPQEIKAIYSTVGVNVENKIIAGRVQETVKAIVAKFTAEELVTKRQIVKDEIAQKLTEQLREYNVIVSMDGVQITSFKFSDAFNKAIEEKQIAEQQALKASNDLERIKIEAEQKVAEAKGNAEAIRIQAEAIQRQGGKDYVSLKSVEKWDGKLPTYLGGGSVPFIDIKR